MLPFIMRKNFDELLKTELLSYWIDLALRLIDSQAMVGPDERILGLTFLTEVWFNFAGYVNSRADL